MQVQKLEALQAKQAAVLRRKTEEADAARRRLKVVYELISVSSAPSIYSMCKPVSFLLDSSPCQQAI